MVQKDVFDDIQNKLQVKLQLQKEKFMIETEDNKREINEIYQTNKVEKDALVAKIRELEGKLVDFRQVKEGAMTVYLDSEN
jgi:hypothetical protein